MKEIWKPLPNYEGYYDISNFGRIRSVKRNLIRKPNPDGSGYLKIDLYKNKIHQTLKIHRLVAITFLDNPKNYPQVNHKDGNILNNMSNNLEWCSPSENAIHKVYILNKNSLYPCKKIKCIELNMVFDSITKASKFVNCKQSSLSRVISKPNYTCKGYHWVYL